MRCQFTTSITIEDELGETDYDVRVIYSHDKGYRGSLTEPPEDASVEILEISPADRSITVPEHFYEDDGLLAECMDDWAIQEADAEEWRAEAARDRLMEGF